MEKKPKTEKPDSSIDFIPIDECVRLLHLKTPVAITRAVKRGDLTGINLRGHHMLIDRKSFSAWLQRYRMEAAHPGKGAPARPRKRRKTEATA